ncbi:MAG: flavin reductase family protein [Euryarchaeota archaeon]|nr:flavin reductase family protein [Euryarchaeota archaeon]
MSDTVVDPSRLGPNDLYKLVISAIVPRPIGFISSRGRDGRLNAAPFSFFNGVCTDPPMVMVSVGFRDGRRKDTGRNIVETGEFVAHIVDEPLAEKMNLCAVDFPPEVSEFEEAGLTPVESLKVKAPGIAEAPVRMECVLRHHIDLGRPTNTLLVGEVVMFHFREGLLQNGRVDLKQLRPIGRLSGNLYCRVTDLFKLERLTLDDYRRRKGASKP